MTDKPPASGDEDDVADADCMSILREAVRFACTAAGLAVRPAAWPTPTDLLPAPRPARGSTRSLSTAHACRPVSVSASPAAGDAEPTCLVDFGRPLLRGALEGAQPSCSAAANAPR